MNACAALDICNDVAVIHNGNQGDALHHIAVGFAGDAQTGGAAFQGNQCCSTDLQRVPVVLAVEIVQDLSVFQSLLGNGLLQGLQLIAVTGKKEENAFLLF